MPYFKWKGVTLEGAVVSGTMQAYSQEDLHQQLLEQHIGIMRSHIVTSFFSRPVSGKQKSDFFQHLLALLRVGIFIDQALYIIGHTLTNRVFKRSVQEMHEEIVAGKSLAQAIAHQHHIFDTTMSMLIKMGHESGNMIQALATLSEYVQMMYEFRKKTKQALLMPCMTLCAFVLVSMFIIGYIMPLFAQTLPIASHASIKYISILLYIAPLFQGYYLGIWLFLFLSCLGLSKKIINNYHMRYTFKDILLYVPGISHVLHTYIALHILSSMTLLLRNGVSLSRALVIVHDQMYWQEYRVQLNHIYHIVSCGRTLKEGFAQYPHLFKQDIYALVCLAEQSGSYTHMFEQATHLQKERLTRQLYVISHVIQPVLMIVLGCAVTLLIITLYYPLLTGVLSIGEMGQQF